MEDVPLCLAHCECAGGVYKARHVDPRLAITQAELLGWTNLPAALGPGVRGAGGGLACPSCCSSQLVSSGVSVSSLFQLADLTVPSCPEMQRETM